MCDDELTEIAVRQFFDITGDELYDQLVAEGRPIPEALRKPS